MKISDKKKQELYKSFSDPIVRLRIEISRNDVSRFPLKGDALDRKLFKLEQEIWQNIATALGIDKP